MRGVQIPGSTVTVSDALKWAILTVDRDSLADLSDPRASLSFLNALATLRWAIEKE